MGVQGEIDKSSWSKIVVSRKEQRNYVMNLSFLEIEALDEVPRKLNLVHPLKAKEGEEPVKLAKDAPPPRRRLKSGSVRSGSVRLNNNRITCLDGSGPAPPEGPPPLSLGSALGSVCADLKALRWLDLSFNNIVRGPSGMAPSRCVFLWAPRWSGSLAAFEAKINDCFDATPGLNVIYLHANRISALSLTKPLGSLADLRSLTLHGNPIEDKKHYRPYVVTTCSKLNQLDFSTITKQDRETASAWALTYRRKLNPSAGDEDAA